MDVLSQFGVDGGELSESSTAAKEYPDVVPGRVAHIDADFLAYQTSYEREGEQKSLATVLSHVDSAIDNLRQLAAAEFAVLHLTPKESDKGGRYEQAVLAEYQSTRRGDKPRYLHVVRDYMGDQDTNVITGRLHYRCEADDGMAMEQWEAWSRDDLNRSIIVSGDKDLRMVPGNHLNVQTGFIEGLTDGSTFGYIEYDKSKSKVVGYGTKFFWAQMLMGDTADTITGLPLIVPELVAEYIPTQAFLKAKDKDKALKAIKPKKCGAKAAYDLLSGVENDYDAAMLVSKLYKGGEYVHWRTGEPVTPRMAFLSNAFLLWMRRNNDPQDFTAWLNGVMNG